MTRVRKTQFWAVSFAVALLTLSPFALAQETPSKAAPERRPLTLYQKLEAAGTTGGPAPRRDLSGSWTGPLRPVVSELPPMTPLGQSRFQQNIPDIFSANTNDPWATCDPFGFPRSDLDETRGITFAQLPNRIVIMTEYQKVWRVVWMDGRELPKNIGAKGGPDTTWYGYSVGHWDGEYTLVVETTGVDDRTWLDRRGDPHSADMKVEERFTRINHDTLELTLTIDDPKIYTKPFVLAKNRFKWIPNQEDEEQLCVPSEALEYRKLVVIPAGQDLTGVKK